MCENLAWEKLKTLWNSLMSYEKPYYGIFGTFLESYGRITCSDLQSFPCYILARNELN